MKRPLVLALAVMGAFVLASGCVVVKPVVGAGAAVAGAAVKTTAKATGAVVDAAIPDGKPEPAEESRGK